MKAQLIAVMSLLSAGCSLSPPAPDPGRVMPAPPPAPPGPRLPQGDAVSYQDQTLDFTIIAGPEAMTAGKTETLTARLTAPPGSQVIGVQATQGKDAFTYALKLSVRVPAGAGAARPLEVQFPFTPSTGGTYFLDSARRYAVQVAGAGYGFSSGDYASTPGRTSSFLDRSTYTGGAYVPNPGPTAGTTPASTDTTAKPLFGDVVTLSTLTPGAIVGNDQVTVRNLLAIQGPRYGRHGERMRFTATLWTAGTGPLQPDIVQDNFEVKVSALLAPAEREPLGAPMPRQASFQFSWTFQDPGLYRITSQNGITLGTVQIY